MESYTLAHDLLDLTILYTVPSIISHIRQGGNKNHLVLSGRPGA